jgi:hypothetical protein
MKSLKPGSYHAAPGYGSIDFMDVLTALYELKDKSASLADDDKAFVLATITVHESGTRRLSQHEIHRIEELQRNTQGVRGACNHPITAPVFENGEETNEWECGVCGHRIKIR